MSWSKMNRRRFLKGAAGASLALPLFSSLQPRSSSAATATYKKRILFIYLPHQETTGFAPDASFSFAGSYLAPLAVNHGSRMLDPGRCRRSRPCKILLWPSPTSRETRPVHPPPSHPVLTAAP